MISDAPQKLEDSFQVYRCGGRYQLAPRGLGWSVMPTEGLSSSKLL